MGGARNRSDDKGGGTTYSDQNNKIQNPNIIKRAFKGTTNYVKSGGAVGLILRDLKKFTKPSAKQIEDRKLPFGERNQYYKTSIINNANKGNREFFTNRVLKGTEKANFGSLNSTEQENQYKGYMEKRLSGETDAIGRTKVQGTGGDPSNPQNQVIQTAPTTAEVSKVTTMLAPTTAEIDQGTSTMMSDAEILIKNKKRGRSPTILTGATGLGNSSANTTKENIGSIDGRQSKSKNGNGEI